MTQVNNRLAREVFDYYLKLLETFQTGGKLETLCASDGKTSGMTVHHKMEEEKLPFEVDPASFKSHLFTGSALALTSLAYMHHEEKEECFHYCMKQERERMTDVLISVIRKGNLRKMPDGKERKIRHALALSQLLTREFSQELLDDADQLLHYDSETDRYGDDWSLYYASKNFVEDGSGNVLRNCYVFLWRIKRWRQRILF